MNDITTALATAGVKLPTKLERTWNLLKEEGPKDYRQVQRALNIPEGSASSTLNDLVMRDMATMSRPLMPAGRGKARAVYTAKGRVYALLPRKTSVHAQKVAAVKQAALVTPAAAEPLPPKEFNAQEHVDALTLKQAKAVYEALKEVFA